MATMAKEMRKMVLMNVFMFTVTREWLRCVECVKEDDAGQLGRKKQVRGPLFIHGHPSQ